MTVRLQQRRVVADHDQATPVRRQEVAQPDDRVRVQVVGRLVEQHRLRAGEQDPGQLHPAPLAAAQRGERLAEDPVLDAEAGRDLRGLGLRGVPAAGVQLGVRPLVAAASPGPGRPGRRCPSRSRRRGGGVRRRRGRARTGSARGRARSGRPCAGPEGGSRRSPVLCTVPAAGSASPARILVSVVLPAPLRPTSPILSPAATRKLTPSIRSRAPARTSSWWAVIMTVTRVLGCGSTRRPRSTPVGSATPGRGRSSGGMGGIPIPSGAAGGGIGGIVIVIIIFLVVQFAGGGNLLGGDDAGSGTDTATDRYNECQTGADANENVDCARAIVEDSLVAYWEDTLEPQTGTAFTAERDRHLHRRRVRRAAAATPPRRSGRSTARSTRSSTSTRRSSRTCSRASSAARAATSSSPTSSPTSTATTSRTCSAPWARCRPSRAPRATRSAWSSRPTATPGCGPRARSTPPTPKGVKIFDDLPRSDIDEAIDAAKTVGDDRIQEASGGEVNPEGWTHGSSKQRVKWFLTGFDADSIKDCDTFSASSL